MNLFEWLVHVGLIEGDPTYYSSGKATPDEFKHAIQTAMDNLQYATDPTAKAEFWKRLVDAGAIKGDPTYYSEGKASADEIAHAVNVASSFYSKTGGAGDAPGSGAVGTPGGVLAGGQTISVKAPNGETRYYQVYEFPPGSGQWVAYQYNNREQVEAALGKDFSVTARSDTWFKQNVLAEAAAEEIIGLKGSFQNLTDEIMRDAAMQAGLRDPSIIGRIANDPEMQRIMALATIGNWTPEQVLAEQRNTNFWKNELYPGIERFYGKTASPEQAWANYVSNVTPALRQLGYTPDANGSFDAQIKQMLDAGIDDQAFLSQAPVFAQAQQNLQFAQVLNQWAQRDLGREIGFNDWFDLLAGQSIPELEQLAERASLAYMAQEASAGISEEQVVRLAERTDLSQQEAARLFSDFNQAVLALGESGLRRGGLTRDEVLSAAAGINPDSGRSIEEVRLAVAKLAREEDLFDEEKIQFYLGFGSQGTPQRPGIASLAPDRG